MVYKNMAPLNHLNIISDDVFTTYLKESRDWNELGTKCGYSLQACGDVGRQPSITWKCKKRIIHRIQILKLSTKHLLSFKLGRKIKPVCDLKNGRRRRQILRKKLDDSGRVYVCEWCHCEDMTLDDGEWHWKDKQLTLQIDHINGRDGTDKQDRLENLRYLCPNCHCQTANWGGKRTTRP